MTPTAAVLTVKRVTNNSTGAGPTTTYTYGTRESDPTLCDDPAWIGCTQTTDPNVTSIGVGHPGPGSDAISRPS
jgi:hypothetical protein